MNWIDSFISDNILVCDSAYVELQTKACCEYVLYCSQLKQREILTEKHISILNKIRFSNVAYFEPLLNFCILEELPEISLKLPPSIEVKYIISIISNNEDYSYWNRLLCLFLRKFAVSGLSRHNMYEFTHVIFYSSNFGLNRFISQLDNSIVASLVEITGCCIKICNLSLNWDLARELYLVLLILDSSCSAEIMQLVNTENNVIKSKQGWFLSDGKNLGYYEKLENDLSFTQKYSLYHTTLICSLLEIVIASHGIAHREEYHEVS
ncbi:hypothetical protein CLV84_0700 [Neolewinella xylanilytica]|uniref:DUF6895 domain-containing protein n=1 Tax=Neolewinella xylanilytica TaxID=1514080 RepID=A0A2S6I8E3_9BACT|nr:hypothetical protein CLV84_0700 [Neolewinella xylanilytica]